MRVVQALHWLKDTLGSGRNCILRRLDKTLAEPAHGPAIRQDLIEGFAVLPAWMRQLLRELPSFDPVATRHVAPRERSPALQPAEPVVRCKHAASGKMLQEVLAPKPLPALLRRYSTRPSTSAAG